ncbi:uncharacterized protein FIBRA_04231 [Fibroporia radiculosa]|uniref:Uncharacterized protein n=1 Tax=Fibroporia radiculosa TaxID=599839 RepID=J4G719_9APHY|nr:uncharacterized protein FIBRA_04231 [Fibroporia radiculosa]CCM02153.1 predicted protein [Fibroporia radiculosa]
MTEYDFSEEALERYLATQSRVSNWVSDQVSRVPHHSKPFGAASHAGSGSRSDPARAHGHVVHPRPVRAAPQQLHPLVIPEPRPPQRSSPLKSSPPRSSEWRAQTVSPQPFPVSDPYPHPPHHHHHHHYQERPRPQASRSQTLPPTHNSTLPPLPGGATVYPTRAPMPAPPPGHNAVYRTYQYDPARREIVVPPPRPGETYVIIPPTRGPVEVVHGDGSRSHSRSTSRSSARSPSKKGTPLFKRILGSISPSGNGLSSTRGGPPRSAPPPRRLRRHSTSAY